MIDLIAAASIGGIIGFGVCAVMTAGKVADVQAAPSLKSRADDQLIVKLRLERSALTQAHTRCADALTTKTKRIERALDQVTPGANATVKRMAAILRGDA